MTAIVPMEIKRKSMQTNPTPGATLQACPLLRFSSEFVITRMKNTTKDIDISKGKKRGTDNEIFHT